MKRSFLVFVLNVLAIVFAYSSNITFRHLSDKDGLISNTVNVITQDSDGFMWFGTADGLCRFDGYSFLNFTFSSNNKSSISNNIISSLFEDNNRNLWVGTRNGVNKLNLDTYVMERVTVFNDSIVPLPILDLCVTSDGYLYFGTEFMGLFRMNVSTNEVTQFNHSQKNENTISSNVIYSILDHPKLGLLVATDRSLELFNPKSDTFSTILDGENIQNLQSCPDGSILIGLTAKGNYYYRLFNDLRIEKVTFGISSSGKTIMPLVTTEGDSWVLVSNFGIDYSSEKSGLKKVFTYHKHDFTGIRSNAVNTIFEDKWGKIWIGTHDVGLNIYEKHGKSFTHIKDNYLPNGLQNNKVRSMHQDSEGDIWIGTKVGGSLSKFNRETLTFSHYKHSPNVPSSLSGDFILCIEDDSPRKLWVGTFNGLNLFDKKTGKSTVLKHNPDDLNSISSNGIYALLKDENKLYIGYLDGGLDIYNTKDKTIKHFKHSDDSLSISDNKVRAIFKDSKNNIWVGTVDGLNLFNKEKGTFTRFINNPKDSTSISNNYIISICEDKNQNFWIGTNHGVNLMNKERNEFIALTTNNGLSGNTVKGILDDNDGSIWISTNNGISMYNPVTSKFKNYNVFDGLQGNEFSAHVCCKTQNGELLFGGNNGFNIFHPKHIFDNEIEPIVHIIGFNLFNQEVTVETPNSPLKKHISQSDKITLTHKQSVITFEYVALNYTSSQKNQYAYRMDGFESSDSTWNYVGNKREATYTNLDPGTYTFRVKASNNDDYWNEQGTSVTIEVLPPPWLSWWAFTIYFILIIMMSTLLFNYIIKRAKEEKDHENDQQNLKFFINVSHEFRTPLTLMINPLRQLLEMQKSGIEKDAIETINVSTHKLLSLVNQLLDFRKTDLGHQPLKAVKVDIVGYTKKVGNLFTREAKLKLINFDFQNSEKFVDVWVDIDMYDKILNNLLSNAIKYTNLGGSIVLSISKTEIGKAKSSFLNFNNDKKAEYVEIKVEDTGQGIRREDIKYIFERFYSKDNSKTGTGIGLNYTKSLVELHGGQVLVESSIGKGSTFIVRLPLGKKHLRKDQVSLDEYDPSRNNFESINLESLIYDISSDDLSETVEDIAVGSKKGNGKLPIVLIVEDNKRLRNQLKDDFSGEYIVNEAGNGQEGLEKIKSLNPDIVISDIMMPVMDGMELCGKIKSNLDTCHIPVILLTAKNLLENKMEGFEIGADDYVSKPFSMQLLKIRVKNLVDAKQKLREKYSASPILIPSKEFTTNSIDEGFLDKLTKVILSNLGEAAFDQQQLEKEMGMSRSGLYKKLRSITGYSTSTFIRNVKLKYAAEMLLTSQNSVKEVAYRIGFSSPSYFIEQFRKQYCQTPTEYVKNGGRNSN